ncbi:hypothetical protein CC79DRAFT_1355526 [Sarocladium strictum]
MSLPAHVTPKRKRDEEDNITLSPLKFSFDSSLGQDARDGSNSPRSKVAHRFRGLGLHEGDVATGSGGGVGATGSSQPQVDAEVDQVAKRQRHDECMPDAEEPPRIVWDLIGLQPGDALGITDHHGKTVPQPAPVRDEKLQHQREQESRSTPEPVPDLTDSMVLGKKRAGTPPLRIKKLKPKAQDINDDVVDPVRAALTWHEDEITIYDPDDADDDGTGINGVGFKPTAAIAHARVMKRRQQLAEYKRREESDARRCSGRGRRQIPSKGTIY